MNKGPSSFFRLSIRPWGLLTAAGVVACAATLFGFLGRFSWFLDLFSHFRVQYAAGLTILGLILLGGRRRKMAACFLGFAGVNLLPVLPLYCDGHRALPEGLPTLRAMLLNVNTELGDAERVQRVIHDADPDILVLEEISSRWLADLAWLSDAYPYALKKPRGDNFGIGLFSKFPLTEGKVDCIGSAGVPSILATINTGSMELRVVATHPLPPGGREYSRWRNDQLDQLPAHVRSSLPLILLGDLNTTPWNYHFCRLLQRSGLKDSAQGYGVQTSWPKGNPLFRIPIDHVLHSPDIVIVARRIGPDVGSDHFPVIVDFAILTGTNVQRVTRHAPPVP